MDDEKLKQHILIERKRTKKTINNSRNKKITYIWCVALIMSVLIIWYDLKLWVMVGMVTMGVISMMMGIMVWVEMKEINRV